jgi:hypothetical protein
VCFSTGGALEEDRSPVVLLVQVQASSGGGARWSFAVVCLALSFPLPVAVWRRRWVDDFEADDIGGRRRCSWSWVEAPRSSRSGDFPSARGRLLLQGLKEDAAAARHRHVLFHAGAFELQRDWIVISIFVGYLSVMFFL